MTSTTKHGPIEQATIALADALTPQPSSLAATWRTVAITAAQRADTHTHDNTDLTHALTDALASMVRA